MPVKIHISYTPDDEPLAGQIVARLKGLLPRHKVKKSTGCRIARGKGVPYRIGDRILKPKTGTLADPEIDKMNKVSDSHEGPGVKSLAEEVIAVLYGRFRQGSLRA